MLKNIRSTLMLALLALTHFAHAKTLDYYLPADLEFNPDITTPTEYLGYPVGEWHVRHDQLVGYMKLLAAESDRMHLDVIGQTHEQRQLVQLVVTTPERLQNVESLRQQHLAGQFDADPASPLVLLMGYSVHGDESSGSNAAMLIAYYLAAAQGEKVQRLLQESVVLLDPSLNPDGLDRFANWANGHKGKVLSADPAHREHQQGWLRGRTNHYWFDLNRDWLLLTHPESRARIARFHHWRPHVVTDFHEMGANSTYFFQPGIPTRKNPLTPDHNVTLTKALAEYHAEALDIRGSLYFTEESFDDFYYGKGSTYPDINGSVGILFEQASSRGHLQESINGLLDFPFTIRNQVVTSLSTFDGAIANKDALKAYQTEFYSTAIDEAKKHDSAGYLIHIADDPKRLQALIHIMQQHQIDVLQPQKDIKIEDQVLKAGDTAYVALQQTQFRLIEAIFSTRKDFPDNTFYDVSAWTLPFAFDADFYPLSSRSASRLDANPWQQVSAPVNDLQSAYAYAFDWNDSHAPAATYALLQKGYKVRVATRPFTADTATGERDFAVGSIVVPASIQSDPQQLLADVQAIQSDMDLPVFAINSGLTGKGIDMGSRYLRQLTLPQVLIVGGHSASAYEVGELWHYLDTRVKMPITLVEDFRLNNIDLDRYTHVIMVNGRYRGLPAGWDSKLSKWVKKGGVVIGQKGGLQWLADNELLAAQLVTTSEKDAGFDTSYMHYHDREALAGKKRIAGAIYATELDLSHPINYGIGDSLLPVFKNGTMAVHKTDVPFITVGEYTQDSLMAGYTSSENLRYINESVSALAHGQGRGAVIGFVDNLNFRGFWYGTSRQMANAIFFGGLVDAKAN